MWIVSTSVFPRSSNSRGGNTSPHCQLSGQSSWPHRTPTDPTSHSAALWPYDKRPWPRARTGLQSCLKHENASFRKRICNPDIRNGPACSNQHASTQWFRRVVNKNCSAQNWFALSRQLDVYWPQFLLLSKSPFCIPKSVRTKSTIFNSPLAAGRWRIGRRCPAPGLSKQQFAK